MGIVPPDKISPVTINIFIIPLSSMVNIVMIWISSEIDVTIMLDRDMATKNNSMALMLMGAYNLYGAGNRRAIMVTGKNLSSKAANLEPYIVANHFL